jgi:hypothetical protein
MAGGRFQGPASGNRVRLFDLTHILVAYQISFFSYGIKIRAPHALVMTFLFGRGT